jgi:hypothetical protein
MRLGKSMQTKNPFCTAYRQPGCKPLRAETAEAIGNLRTHPFLFPTDFETA